MRHTPEHNDEIKLTILTTNKERETQTESMVVWHSHIHASAASVIYWQILRGPWWTGRSLPLIDGESWLRDSGLRLAVCSALPPDILTVNVCAAVSPLLQSTSCRPTTSRNRKSGMFLRAAVTGPDKIERYRRRAREGFLRKRKDSWPLTHPTPRVLWWRCPVWRGRSLVSCPPQATALPLHCCLCVSVKEWETGTTPTPQRKFGQDSRLSG